MKKILTILSIAVMAISVVSCERDDETQQDKPNNGDGRKLPSRVTVHNVNTGLTIDAHYLYDEQNRVTRVIRAVDTFDVFYLPDGRPEKVLRNGSPLFVFEFVGNQVFVGGDFPILTLNNRGQALRHYAFRAYGVTVYVAHTFDENGSMVKMYIYTGLPESDYWRRTQEFLLTPSNVPGIFRHSNTPEWLLSLLEENNLFHWSHKYGYLFETFETLYSGEMQELPTITAQFQLDSDGNVVEIETVQTQGDRIVARSRTVIEYILAN